MAARVSRNARNKKSTTCSWPQKPSKGWISGTLALPTWFPLAMEKTSFRRRVSITPLVMRERIDNLLRVTWAACGRHPAAATVWLQRQKQQGKVVLFKYLHVGRNRRRSLRSKFRSLRLAFLFFPRTPKKWKGLLSQSKWTSTWMGGCSTMTLDVFSCV
jgi:hypothetical protein